MLLLVQALEITGGSDKLVALTDISEHCGFVQILKESAGLILTQLDKISASLWNMMSVLSILELVTHHPIE